MKLKTFLVAMLVFHVSAAVVSARLIACVGDSITYGAGITDRLHDSYPTQLERILKQCDPAWEVENFGVSGATLLRRGDKPYVREGAYTAAQACDPDVVIIQLGTNDSKPQNWQYKDDFVADYCELIDAFQALPSRPEVWICKPVPAFRVNFAIRPEVIRDEVLPLIDEIARLRDVPVIDLYTALLDSAALFPDGIHPNAEGAGLMAKTIAPFFADVRFLPDFSHDGILNLVDFAMLAAGWRSEEPSLDVSPSPDGDGMVAYEDLMGLCRHWMTLPGLLGHWQFDETDGDVAYDRAGRFDGTLHGKPQWRPDGGIVRGALELDGIDDYVGTGCILNPADGPFTVFVWIKGGGPGQAILSQSSASGSGETWLGIDSATGVLMTDLNDGGRRARPLASSAVVSDDSWHHVRFVWDGRCRYLYLDGKEAAIDTQDVGNLRSSNADFLMGAGKDLEPGSLWSGLLDDLRICNQAIRP